MAEFDIPGDIDVPELPVVDLITLRAGSTVDQVTEDHLYYCQYNWRAAKLYRLTSDRRKDLCTLLVSLVKKKAPDLVGSEMYRLWEKTAKNPSVIDGIFKARSDQ